MVSTSPTANNSNSKHHASNRISMGPGTTIKIGSHERWSSVFLDISKAYDSTWHTGLLYKLIQMHVPGELIKVIDSFLARRSFRVKMDGAVSEWKPMLDASGFNDISVAI